MTKTAKEIYKANAQKMVRKMAVDQALEWFDNVIEAHKRTARELEDYKLKFKRALVEKDSIATPVAVLGWAMNELKTIPFNIRTDLVPTIAASLALTEPKEEEANKPPVIGDDSTDRVVVALNNGGYPTEKDDFTSCVFKGMNSGGDIEMHAVEFIDDDGVADKGTVFIKPDASGKLIGDW